MTPSADGAAGDLHAVFRPRAARLVALVLAVLVLGGAFAIAVAMPRVPGSRFGPADQVGTVVLAAGICWFLYRQASVVAVPGARGLRVRNLVVTREVEWAQIVSVNLGAGDPWVRLDLADGDTLPVMAVQSADGDRGRTEARRLATLVALHEPPDRA